MKPFRHAGAFGMNGELLALSTESEVRILRLPSLKPIAVFVDPILTQDVKLICFNSSADRVAVATNTDLSIWSVKYPKGSILFFGS